MSQTAFEAQGDICLEQAMRKSPAMAVLKTIVCVAGKTRGGLKMNERNQAVHSTTSRWECYNSTTMWHIEQPGGT